MQITVTSADIVKLHCSCFVDVSSFVYACVRLYDTRCKVVYRCQMKTIFFHSHSASGTSISFKYFSFYFLVFFFLFLYLYIQLTIRWKCFQYGIYLVFYVIHWFSSVCRPFDWSEQNANEIIMAGIKMILII